MAQEKDYFDITRLYPVLKANQWTEGEKFMKFWANCKAKTASVDPAKGKSTIGANIGKGLSIYIMTWQWLQKFAVAKTRYKQFFTQRASNEAVKRLLIRKYKDYASSQTLIAPINPWLVDGLLPYQYTRYIKNEQLQFIQVNTYELNGGKFDDLVAALNGFNYFAFYKGFVLNGDAFRKAKIEEKLNKEKQNIADHAGTGKPLSTPATDALAKLPKSVIKAVERQLESLAVKKLIVITHVGMYAGDIYEFNGTQYLATWNLKKNTVEISLWDRAWGTSDTDDENDLAITNETFQVYRTKTGQGGDFIALTPIKLVEHSLILPVN